MEPQIKYAKTADGVRIAYFAVGQGPPTICMNLPNSHVQMEWQMSDIRQAYEFSARFSTFVRYDHRGFGLSDRDVSGLSMDALLCDIDAVVNQLGLDTFDVMAYRFAVPLAITLAARQPERVSRLVVWPGYARLPLSFTDALDRLLAPAAGDWEFETESVVRLVQGWSDEMAPPAAALLRECVTREMLLEFFRQTKKWDVTELLPGLTVPTLVLHEKAGKYLGAEMGREMAAALPDGRLVILDGASRPERMGQAVAAILSFLRDQQPAPEQEPPQLPQGTAVILFADIVDSTALTEGMGDAAFRDKARDLDTALRDIIRECAGTTIEGKLLGDGVLAVFTSARQAIEAALRCGKAGSHGGLPLHLGVHAGDVIREGDNVFGGAVNIAARIAAASAPGEVLVSDTVRGLARTSAGVSFENRGEHELKGVSEPQRLFAIKTV